MISATDCMEALIELRMILSGNVERIEASPSMHCKIAKECRYLYDVFKSVEYCGFPYKVSRKTYVH